MLLELLNQRDYFFNLDQDLLSVMTSGELGYHPVFIIVLVIALNTQKRARLCLTFNLSIKQVRVCTMVNKRSIILTRTLDQRLVSSLVLVSLVHAKASKAQMGTSDTIVKWRKAMEVLNTKGLSQTSAWAPSPHSAYTVKTQLCLLPAFFFSRAYCMQWFDEAWNQS